MVSTRQIEEGVQVGSLTVKTKTAGTRLKGNSDCTCTRKVLLLTHITSTAVRSEKTADSCPALQQLEKKKESRSKTRSGLTVPCFSCHATQMQHRLLFFIYFFFVLTGFSCKSNIVLWFAHTHQESSLPLVSTKRRTTEEAFTRFSQFQIFHIYSPMLQFTTLSLELWTSNGSVIKIDLF